MKLSIHVVGGVGTQSPDKWLWGKASQNERVGLDVVKTQRDISDSTIVVYHLKGGTGEDLVVLVKGIKIHFVFDGVNRWGSSNAMTERFMKNVEFTRPVEPTILKPIPTFLLTIGIGILIGMVLSGVIWSSFGVVKVGPTVIEPNGPKVEPKKVVPTVNKVEPKVNKVVPKVNKVVPKVNKTKVNEPEVNEPKVNEPKVNEPEVNEPKVNEPKFEPSINDTKFNETFAAFNVTEEEDSTEEEWEEEDSAKGMLFVIFCTFLIPTIKLIGSAVKWSINVTWDGLKWAFNHVIWQV